MRTMFRETLIDNIEASVPSGAKAPVFTGPSTAGLKPRPFKAGRNQRFPWAKAQGYQPVPFKAGLKASAWGVLLLASSFVLPARVLQGQSQVAGIPKEEIEWTWSDHSATLDPKLPNILLAGDSITRAYFPEVAKRFAGKANVYLFATSCSSGDPRLTQQLHLYFETAPAFRVIHFNNGMHGWDYSEAAFMAGLPGMIRELKKESHGSKLIWATITPVRKDNSEGATNARIDARNALALAVMKHDGIPVDDQHALMAGHGDLHLDDVHFNDKGSEIQGDQAAESIEGLLASSKTLTSPK